MVDDSLDFRVVLRKRLESLGCNAIVEAADAESGLAAFREFRPDLVTLDLIMPDRPEYTSGDLFKTIREESPETAILVITSQSRRVNASRFLSQGAIGYLEKCFGNFAEVKQTLQRIFPGLSKPGILGRVSARGFQTSYY